MAFSDNAQKIAEERYTQDGEDIFDMFSRVAEALADKEMSHYVVVEEETGTQADEISAWAKQKRKVMSRFYDVMVNKKFLPAGRTLTNAGTNHAVVANCVVLGIDDSLDSIYKTLHEAALLQQQGCGLGFNFSNLRPAGFKTIRSNGTASGPVSFMKVYNDAFSKIKQQGRHGANMGMLRIDHPDILDFISCKSTEGSFNNFNISVLVTDEFMEKLVEDPNQEWTATFNGKPYPLREVFHRTNMFGDYEEVVETSYTIGEIWHALCRAAWANGEPGIAFIDEVNRTNPLPGLGDIECCNPCGEEFMHPYDNCNLGSINLHAHVFDGMVQWDELEETIRTAVRMLDNTIDLFEHKVSAINKMAQANRRIGLGVMGFADYLFEMGIRYGSKESCEIANVTISFINAIAHEESELLGRERGNYPNVKQGRVERRNACTVAIAPTGSISMLFDVNGGIEPYFNLGFTKTIRAGSFDYFPQTFLNAVDNIDKEEWPHLNVDEIKKALLDGFTLQRYHEELGEVPQELLDVFVTTREITPGEHVDVQATFQEFVTNSISKTVNFPEEATVEDVEAVYLKAWRKKCKSVTVYRDNSRKFQVLSTGDANRVESDDRGDVVLNYHGTISRPDIVKGDTEMINTADGKLYVTVNYWEYNGTLRPFEVFAQIGKIGGDVYAYMSALTRSISISLRSGTPLEKFVEQLQGISSRPMWHNGKVNLSPVDALSQVLARHIDQPIAEKDENTSKEPLKIYVTEVQQAPGENCPFSCNGMFVYEEGCQKCLTCGWSQC